MSGSGWQFWIDRGGTFTDVIARDPEGQLQTRKLLSENPGHYDDAVLEGIRSFLGVAPSAPIPSEQIAALKVGTTVATNALLERRGEPLLLVTNQGFGDALQIAYQNRPDLFALDIKKPAPLYPACLEVAARMGAGGEELSCPDKEQTLGALRGFAEQGLKACAIVLIHADRYPAHEQRIAEWAREAGFRQVSVSSELSPIIRLISRGQTTVVDAYLSPVLRRYVDRLSLALPDLARRPAGISFMTSNGGLAGSGQFRGKDAILSGPAGGVIGMVRCGQKDGLSRLIGFDMGGTSTDVCHYSGELERQFEHQIAGLRLQLPMLAVHTVAAGGGSVLKYRQGRLVVGPESAGAHPGPCAYRKGGPLTVTDCNVMLGRLQAEHFPRVFGSNADEGLDPAGVKEAFSELAETIARDSGTRFTPEALAEGFLAVAIENMAMAVQQISTQKGHDLSDYALCSFGGAGGQHACLMAETLGMQTVYLPPLAGVLSALGIGLAQHRIVEEVGVEAPLTGEQLQTLESVFRRKESAQKKELQTQSAESKPEIRQHRRISLRIAGSDYPFVLPWSSAEALEQSLKEAHESLFGFPPPASGRVIHSIIIESEEISQEPEQAVPVPDFDTRDPQPLTTHSVYIRGRHVPTPFFDREAIAAGHSITGPAVLLDPNSTVVVPDGWRATVSQEGGLIIHADAAETSLPAVTGSASEQSPACDPLKLELFNNRFMFIAEQMGVVLEQTAQSVNIRERLDFSCALFTASGELIANAPHVPVHLGSMSHSVQAVIEKYRSGPDQTRLQPGDVCMLNDPYQGGTHLPDITLVKPAFREDGSLAFFVAARGHHADIGGTLPGSMPWNSSDIREEGILFPVWRLVRQGVFREDSLMEKLLAPPYPARNPRQNVADLKAQVGACEAGVRQLEAMVARYGFPLVQRYMGWMLDNGEQAVRQMIPRLQGGEFRLRMDHGAEIRLRLSLDTARGSAVLDFSGSSPQSLTNYNAPLSVVHAAVLYVFRCLVNAPIPLNAGCLRPLRILVPEGSFLNPLAPAAVVAGNVEVSQALVCALFGAMGLKASAQATMNNLIWGDQDRQYYETIGGGDGATAQADGQSAVHTHMTNSRLTDPEILETRYPVRLLQCAIRRGSGGRGERRGGDGIVREFEFLAPLEVSLLSNSRQRAPFGLQGGEPGQPGSNRLLRQDGREENLPAAAGLKVAAGDRLIIETPGGGAYGKAP